MHDLYHCHTCKMVDGVGVCTVCAKVCHKDHEISYAKYGSFFCDCGAKEDGSNPCNEDYLAVCGLKVRTPASFK
uniref:UBR-type domain-containing protein n=1 Tax=Labrus bergylta TaxID=56723 RepID=A0A3Q3EJ52_9LABR